MMATCPSRPPTQPPRAPPLPLSPPPPTPAAPTPPLAIRCCTGRRNRPTQTPCRSIGRCLQPSPPPTGRARSATLRSITSTGPADGVCTARMPAVRRPTDSVVSNEQRGHSTSGAIRCPLGRRISIAHTRFGSIVIRRAADERQRREASRPAEPSLGCPSTSLIASCTCASSQPTDGTEGRCAVAARS